MALTSEQSRALLVRKRAKEFAREVKASRGWAFHLPEKTLDWLRDEEIETFKEHLRSLGLVQRQDFRWEASQ